jgi:hypothetical protein
MAKYEDYINKSKEETIVQEEIDAAAVQQEVRQETTPDVNWQKRYEDLEVAYSRQGQQMGDYRKVIDEFVSTPEIQPEIEVDASPITADDIYDNPAEAVNRAVDAHPAILKAKQLEKDLAEQKAIELRSQFALRHPDYQTVYESTEFANWVAENPLREDLRQRAATFDMTAADALFSLWEAEQQVATSTEQVEAANVASVSLESGVGAESPAAERYSRSEMLDKKIRAKQGDIGAERYVKAHAVAYREALQAGNVRD